MVNILFQIYLPNGASIKVQGQGKFLNVWMTAGASDFNSTQGRKLINAEFYTYFMIYEGNKHKFHIMLLII